MAHTGRSFIVGSLFTLNRSIIEPDCLKAAPCGGSAMDDWLPLPGTIETHAKAEGCACVRIYERKG